MADLPADKDGIVSSPFGRGARLLSLPLGVAARTTAGWGRRLAGADREEISARNAERAAQQMFQVLGELKGGAMKFGQALSLMEAALPEDQAEPFRAQLQRLQDAAPPMPTSKVYGVLAGEFGPGWRGLFSHFSPRPVAAASIGQVHRATWAETGEEVAVKIQYPGAEEALLTDLAALRRLAATIAPLTGGVDVVALTREITDRVAEEVDYRREADAQNVVSQAFGDRRDFFVPRALRATRRAMVSEWVDGVSLRDVAEWPRERRNRIGLNYVRFLFAAPALAGVLHGDPHPGNYLVTADGRLAALDFGLVTYLPDGLPSAMGRLVSLARDGKADDVAAGLAEEGFLTADIPPAALLAYLTPFFEPAAVREFHFTREWMREQFVRVRDLESTDNMALKLTVPPVYALIYRVWLGGIAVLAQLDVRASFADVLDEFLPGWTPAA
jgi:predicted unusual protein kinase regulating ubiquinone biosynthesis (AarF/ABC1/UbiB family)